jgi:hypothetical protein
MVEQTVNRRQDGTFATGNQIGRQFQPGQSGNPKGRPTERPLTASLREALNADDGKLIETLAQVSIDKALSGDFRYFREIMDRVDGKVTDRLDVTADGNALTDCPGLSPEQREMLAEMNDGPTE